MQLYLITSLINHIDKLLSIIILYLMSILKIYWIYLFLKGHKYNTRKSNSMNQANESEKDNKQVQDVSSLNVQPIRIKENTSYLQKLEPKSKKKQIKSTIQEPILQSQIQDSIQDVLPIHKTQQHSLSDSKASQRLTVKNKLSDIRSQKEKIMNSLIEVNHQISSIKYKERRNSQLQKRQTIYDHLQAHQNALQLVKYYRQQKRELQEKKKAHTFKIMMNLKHQTAQNQKKHRQLEQTRREEKRKAISQRLEESRMHRENNKLILRQTNQFISKLLKQEKELEKHRIDLLKQQSERRINLVGSISKQDLQKSALFRKSRVSNNRQESSSKRQRSTSINHTMKRYKKSKWSEILEESNNRQRQQNLTKQIIIQINRKKRLKYGQLVVSLFPKKRRARTLPNPQQQIRNIYAEEPHQIQVNNAPFPKEQISQSKVIDNHTQSVKVSPIRSINIFKSQMIQKLTLKQVQIQNKKIMKESQLRKQNKQRLKRITRTYQPQPYSKYQSKYQNYLGIFKTKKHSGPQNWNKILNSQLISKQQKYQKMLRQAQSLQNKAKLKEQIFRRSDDSSDDLFMSSITAKLMILYHI